MSPIRLADGTMRRQVLDYCGALASLHDIQVRLLAWLDTHYHQAPHGGLMGNTPIGVYLPARGARNRAHRRGRAQEGARRIGEPQGPARHHVSIDGRTFEIDRGWLAGRQIAVLWSALEDPIRPWAEYEGKRYEQNESPALYEDGQLRTLQRRLKEWRRAAAQRLVFTASNAAMLAEPLRKVGPPLPSASALDLPVRASP